MKRNTTQCELVLSAVRRMHDHPTTEHTTISRETVYRNLNQLTLNGQLHKIE